MKNFHVPITPELHARLHALARSLKRPATQVVREAVEHWIEEAEREALAREIREWATANAGTRLDLDEELEAAGEEHLRDEVPEP